MRIDLSNAEVGNACMGGMRRNISSIRDGRKDNHGLSGPGWNEHIVGAIGEMVVAKALGIYWSAGVDTFKDPDLGVDIQVRCSDQPMASLIVRDDDKDDHRFVLVVGVLYRFHIVGWMYGDEAKQQRWYKNPNGRGFAYFVPQTELKDMEDWRE